MNGFSWRSIFVAANDWEERVFPPGYGQYQANFRAMGRSVNPQIAKFAGQLNSIEILGASEALTTAYLASLRLSLAYSAFESLVSALDIRGSVALKSEGLAVAFRSARLARFRAFLTNQPQTAAMRRRLEKFAGSVRDTDILPVVEATRHLMFHGVLNPSAAGITSKSAIAFIDGLCFRVFEEMDLLSHNFFSAADVRQDNVSLLRRASNDRLGAWKVFEYSSVYGSSNPKKECGI